MEYSKQKIQNKNINLESFSNKIYEFFLSDLYKKTEFKIKSHNEPDFENTITGKPSFFQDRLVWLSGSSAKGAVKITIRGASHNFTVECDFRKMSSAHNNAFTTHGSTIEKAVKDKKNLIIKTIESLISKT